jgi:hypothetical protein
VKKLLLGFAKAFQMSKEGNFHRQKPQCISHLLPISTELSQVDQLAEMELGP